MALRQLSNVFLALVILSPWQANPSTNNAVLMRAFLRQAALLAVLGIGQRFSIFFTSRELIYPQNGERNYDGGRKVLQQDFF